VTITARALAPAVLTTGDNGVMDQSCPKISQTRPCRRTFTVEKKLEYDAAEREERGALLRREAIYTSRISEWRRQRDLGKLSGPPARPRKSAEQVELERLRKRNEQLEKELRKTKLVLDIPGKAHALLELLSESADNDKRPPRCSPARSPNSLR